MTEPTDDHPRKQQAEAMASAQMWGLVAHACAIFRGHPHAAQMMADDIGALESAGAMELVLATLGAELDTLGGAALAIEELGVRVDQDREHIAVTCATMVAESLSFDGENALRRQRECQALADRLRADNPPL